MSNMEDNRLLENQLHALDLSPPSLPPQETEPAFQRLPIEILLLIIEEAASEPWYIAPATLRAASLVCHALHQPSVTLLHKDISLMSERQAERFAESSSLGRYQTRRLRLCGRKGLAASTAQILGKIQGLETLILGKLPSSDMRPTRPPLVAFKVLCTPNLSTLRCLMFNGVRLQLPTPAKRPTLRFQLKTLGLGHYTSQDTEIFTCFAKSNPQVLRFSYSFGLELDPWTFPRPQHSENLRKFLLGINEQLNALKIDHLSSVIGRTIPLFSNLVALQHLSIPCSSFVLQCILSSLPNSLNSLFYKASPGEVESTIEVFSSSIHLTSLQELQSLDVAGGWDDDFEKMFRESGLVDAFHQRGVTMRFGRMVKEHEVFSM